MLFIPNFAQAPPAPSLYVAGIARAVNLNLANTDTPIPLNLPPGLSGYRFSQVLLRNYGTTASLSTATAGLFSAAAGGGVALSPIAALSGITANAVNTNNNILALAFSGGMSLTWWNFPTVYFRTGAAQGAAALGDVYVLIIPLP